LGLDERGYKIRVEPDRTIRCGVEYFAKFEFDESLVTLLLAQQQAYIRSAAADLTAQSVCGVGVSHLRFIGDIARQHIGLLGTTRLDPIAGHEWQGEIDGRVAGVGRHFQDQRLGVAVQFEEAAVWQDTRSLADDQSPHVQELQINFQRQEAPGVTTQQTCAKLELMIEIAIVVLQMLRAQQHSFLPDDLIVIHWSSALARLSTWLTMPS
jgi:hypothetical protein